MERPLYIPRGRRQLIAEKAIEQSRAKEINDKNYYTEDQPLESHESNKVMTKRPKQIELYVPKGRKLLNEQSSKLVINRNEDKVELCEQREPMTNESSPNEDKDVKLSEQRECTKETLPTVSIKSSTKTKISDEKTYVPHIEDDEFFFGKVSDDQLLSCSLLLNGYRNDISDSIRGKSLEYFIQKGASYVWRCKDECVLLFKSEKLVDIALSGWSSNGSYRVQRFNPASDDREDVLKAAREAFAKGFKPIQRDTSVANRIIGAALGLRVSPQWKRPTNAPSCQSTSKSEAPLKIMDAWDD
mmetsp:Transcript_14712/g.20167  ORF Transcript_14712/g.20167 Transcript_14712/m.20167 type:complete len:300 (+) Transcript_14712:26-925(+)